MIKKLLLFSALGLGLGYSAVQAQTPDEPFVLFEQGPEALEKETQQEDGWQPSFWKGDYVTASAIDLSQIAKVNLKSDGTEIFADSFCSDVSPDGKFVTFITDSRRAGGGTEPGDSVFRFNTATGVLENISDLPGGQPLVVTCENYPKISQAGNRIVLGEIGRTLTPNYQENRTDVILSDADAETLELISLTDLGEVPEMGGVHADISGNGRFVVHSSRGRDFLTNGPELLGNNQIYRHDTLTDRIVLVSVSSNGAPSTRDSLRPSISSNGRYVVFNSTDAMLSGDVGTFVSHIFIRDIIGGTTDLISRSSNGAIGDASSFFPEISDNGNFVVFESNANNLVVQGGGSNKGIFYHDLRSGVTELVSVALDGGLGDNESSSPSISANGQFVAFKSGANNLVDDIVQLRFKDIFVRDMFSGKTAQVNININREAADNHSSNPRISSDGKFIVFQSIADNLVANDTNLNQFRDDIFITRNPLYNEPPVARWWYRCTGLTCEFFANPSYDEDGEIVSYFWKFEAGQRGKFGKNVTHTFSAPGIFSPFLTVKDDDGAKTRNRRNIAVGQ